MIIVLIFSHSTTPIYTRNVSVKSNSHSLYNYWPHMKMGVPPIITGNGPHLDKKSSDIEKQKPTIKGSSFIPKPENL